MQTDHALVEHWNGEFHEADLEAWVHQLRERFEQPVTLGLIFISPAYFEVASEILEIVRTHAAVPLLVGCSSQWLIAGGTEIEEDAGIVLSLYSLPGAQLDARHFSRSNSESDLSANELTRLVGTTPKALNGFLLFANPLDRDKCVGAHEAQHCTST